MPRFEDFLNKRLESAVPQKVLVATVPTKAFAMLGEDYLNSQETAMDVNRAFESLTGSGLLDIFLEFVTDQKITKTDPLKARVEDLRRTFGATTGSGNVGLLQTLNRLGDQILLSPSQPLAREVILDSAKSMAASGQLLATVRPVRPGFSVGAAGLASGTIAGFLKSKTKGVYLLSNAHVLTGNVSDGNPGNAVLQPGGGDGGSEQIGAVACVCPIAHKGKSTIDAAVALLKPDIEVSAHYDRIGELKGIRSPQVGDAVRMVCRTSGYVEGVVRETNYSASNLKASPNLSCSVYSDYVGIVRIERSGGICACRSGDSGGLWIGSDGKACALNFAGNGCPVDRPNPTEKSAISDTQDFGYRYSFACDIVKVLDYFRSNLGDPDLGLMGEGGKVFSHS